MQANTYEETGVIKEQAGSRAVEYTLVALLFFIEVLFMQWLGDAFEHEYTNFADEGAHYVSALMVHDYIKDGDWSNPMEYAENYYMHYPKVAIGHWPPVLYAALGIWFLIFGVSRITAMCFIAVIVATTATVIYGVARSSLGRYAGIFAASLFIILPITQMSTNAVMLEHLVTMLTFVSVIFFAQFLSTEKFIYGLWFALFASAAILTRGSAWSIGLVPILTMLIAWKFNMLLRPSLWLSAVPVIVLCAPWYLLMPSVNVGAFHSESIFDPSFTQVALHYFSNQIYIALGVVVFLLFIIGVWTKLISPRFVGEKIEIVWATLAAMLLATLIIHIVIPASLEPRYMLTVMPVTVLFAAAGVERIMRSVQSIETKQLLHPVAYLIVAGIFLATNFKIAKIENEGYVDAYSSIVEELGIENVNILIASGVFGEGSVVAESATVNRLHNNVVLRGSKLLVNEDWQGRNSEDKFTTSEELIKLFNDLHVDAVILDIAVPEERRRNYHDLLETTLLEENSDWKLVQRHNVTKNGTIHQYSLLVFIADVAYSRQRDTEDIDLKYVRKLYDGE